MFKKLVESSGSVLSKLITQDLYAVDRDYASCDILRSSGHKIRLIGQAHVGFVINKERKHGFVEVISDRQFTPQVIRV